MENIKIEILSEIHFKIVDVDGVLLKVYKDGRIYRWMRSRRWKLIPNVSNNKGYNRIGINGKPMYRHRIICYCFKDLDIENKQAQIDHIDHNRLNNDINNLRIVSNQQNNFNRNNVKGYYFDQKRQKYRAVIYFNIKTNLGDFDTEDEARKAYLRAKEIYHVI